MTPPTAAVPIPIMRPWLGEAEVDAAAEAIRSGWIAQGPRVAAFEATFADLVGASDAVALSNCTTALHLALVLLGLGPGDEVVVPSLSFIASTNAVRYVGATPVFADVDITTGNLAAETIEPVLTSRTRAVMLVHQAGVPCDVDAVRRLCQSKDIAVLEDAACAIGSTYRGHLVGSDSDLVAFSFHPRKIVTTGEGGMLAVSGPDLATRARRLREHGMSISAAERHRLGGTVMEEYLEVGFNYRMTDVQAAIGSVQLGRLPQLVARRRELAARYQDGLRDVHGVRAVTDPPYGTTNYQSFWVLLDERFPMDRDGLMAHLAAQGISCRRGIMAAHREPAYADLHHAPLPNTELLTSESLILPLFHELAEADQDHVIDAIRKVAA